MAAESLVQLRKLLLDQTNTLCEDVMRLQEEFMLENRGETVPINSVKSIFGRMGMVLKNFREEAGLQSKNQFDILPIELVFHVLSFLSLESLVMMHRVCKRFDLLLRNDESIWEQKCNHWWKDQGLDHNLPLSDIVEEAKINSQRIGWRWFGNCFAFPSRKDGLSVKTGSSRAFDEMNCGEMKGGCLNGYGVMLFAESTAISFAMGNCLEGELNGFGYYRWRNGNRYAGQFVGGVIEGKGIETFFSGSVYDGEFKADVRDGFGVFRFASGVTCEGQWKNDLMEGLGKISWPNSGYSFEGKFKGDIPEDEWQCLHPSIRKCIEVSQCTGVVTGKTEHYGQFYWICDHCKLKVCQACKKNCHNHGTRVWSKRRWGDDGMYCSCADNPDECGHWDEDRPLKRLKRE